MLDVLQLVKARLGISSDVRDEYLKAIIAGVRRELDEQQGIIIDDGNEADLMFLVDYAVYRYQNAGELGAMPRHLAWRLRNRFVKGDKIK